MSPLWICHRFPKVHLVKGDGREESGVINLRADGRDGRMQQMLPVVGASAGPKIKKGIKQKHFCCLSLYVIRLK